jgi:membrane fusion protein, epimerase transport system
MARDLAMQSSGLPMPAPTAAPSDSARGPILIGLAILALFFGVFGGWATLAPLNAAVMGEAVVKVEGNRKSVQHLAGGIVKELRVRDGDSVATGDILVVLDDTTSRAELNVLEQQATTLQAMAARLVAERDGASEISFPAELQKPGSEDAVAAQRQEFESRRAAIQGETRILTERAAQLGEQITGSEAQIVLLETQLTSVRDERASLQKLFDDGVVPRTRLLQLERTASGIEGQIASLNATIASGRAAIAENSQRVLQLGLDRMAEVNRQLADVQSRLLDLTPRLSAATAALARMEIRAPYAGRVVDLAVFSVGAVIGPGERVLDIVPEAPSLVVEARIRVEDIADIAPGMTAEVHFTSYKQRITPLIHGRVADISADRLTDPRTQMPYYVTHVVVDPEELAMSPEIQLYPGMPATVMITTEARTALDYLVGPLFASLDQSFRQR